MSNEQESVTDAVLNSIIARASSLWDRLDSYYVAAEKRSPLARKRLARWQDSVAQGDATAFHKRLEWSELPQSDDLSLGLPQITNSAKIPSWVTIFTESISLAPQVLTLDVASAPDEDEPGPDNDDEFSFLTDDSLPFEELLVPLVLVARHRLAINDPANADHDIAPTAYADMERFLLVELARFSKQVFQRKFNLSRVFSDQTDELYPRFLDRMLNQGDLLKTFDEFPVLARLLASTVQQWVDDHVLFLRRLKNDRALLEQHFNDGRPLGPLIGVEDGLSDPHNGRRFVKKLRFESNVTIIYKPRSVQLLAAFQEFVKAINRRMKDTTLETISVLPRDHYGWVQSVRHNACHHKDETNLFFKRAGALLAVVYLLEGTDCHKENVIANGAQPILIDAETLLNPECKAHSGSDHRRPRFSETDEHASVLNTGLLPRWEATGEKADISALGAVVEQDMEIPVVRWVDVNTDRMRRTEILGKNLPMANNVVYEGQTFVPNDFVDEITEGFRRVCVAVDSNQDEILRAIQEFSELSTRFIFRPTRVYFLLQQKLLEPQYLKDGAERSIALDVLGQALLYTETRPSIWKVFEREIEQMEGLDIPFFEAPVNDTKLTTATDSPDLFRRPSYDAVRHKVATLSDDQIQLQTDYIRGSCYARVANSTQLAAPPLTPNEAQKKQRPLSDDELRTVAFKVCSDIGHLARRSRTGSVTWTGLQFLPETGRFQVGPLGPDLYSGTAGIGVLFAAEAVVRRNQGLDPSKADALVDGAFQPIRQFAHEANGPAAIAGLGLGGCSGLGSMIYGLTLVANMLRRNDWFDDAIALSNLITEEAIRNDKTLDVLSGSAGTLLALLALWECRPEKRVLALAETCGCFLLEQQTKTAVGTRAWETFKGKALCGFSHGAAGIALALLRLYRCTHDSTFRDAAREGISYERQLYSTQLSNWPDLREESSPAMVSWCHGAAGIGLGRVACLEIETDDVGIRNDAEKAVQKTLDFEEGGVDQLCCGEMGRMELLAVASQAWNRPELLRVAKDRASRVIRRAGAEHAFHLVDRIPHDLVLPSLFQGRAGIAYELFRLVNPEVIPSVLTFEISS